MNKAATVVLYYAVNDCSCVLKVCINATGGNKTEVVCEAAQHLREAWPHLAALSFEVDEICWLAGCPQCSTAYCAGCQNEQDDDFEEDMIDELTERPVQEVQRIAREIGNNPSMLIH